MRSRVSELLLFNDKSAIFQLYHGDSKCIAIADEKKGNH
jgi:hypothetical protein